MPHWHQHSKNIEKVVLNTGLKTVGKYAFYDYYFGGLENLTEVVFSSTITAIAEWAFLGSQKLKSITIPASVTSIGYAACKR